MGDILFTWGCSSYFGWGVVGLNLMLHWEGSALCVVEGPDALLPEGDPRMPLLRRRLEQSQDMRRRLLAAGYSATRVNLPVLCSAINPHFGRMPIGRQMYLSGTPTICWIMFEDEDAARRNVGALAVYDRVWTGSDWNTAILRDCGIEATTVHQGVDMALFNPSVRQRRGDGRFRVFSGGKCEYRKGQDLVIQAFARFGRRHSEAQLVCAWYSPWQHLAQEFEGTPVGTPPGTNLGMPNYSAWLQRNGIAATQVEVVPRTPNCGMPQVYGGCDVGLFASRLEGGTNLMAVECMACGVPALVTDVGGHRDLAVAYCEPTIDSIEQHLEMAYAGNVPPPPDMGYWDWYARIDALAEQLK